MICGEGWVFCCGWDVCPWNPLLFGSFIEKRTVAWEISITGGRLGSNGPGPLTIVAGVDLVDDFLVVISEVWGLVGCICLTGWTGWTGYTGWTGKTGRTGWAGWTGYIGGVGWVFLYSFYLLHGAFVFLFVLLLLIFILLIFFIFFF